MKPPSPELYKVLHWCDFGIFPGSVLFSAGFTIQEILERLPKIKHGREWMRGLQDEKISDMLKRVNGLAISERIKDKTYYYIIMPDKFDFSDHHYTTLAHEIIHICQFLLPDVLTRDREIEAEAYLHSHIMKQCLNAIRK